MVASEGLGAGRSRPGGFAEGPFQPLNASNDTWTESRFRGLGGLISFALKPTDLAGNRWEPPAHLGK